MDDICDTDVVFGVGSTTVYVDGNTRSPDTAPVLSQGPILVPLRAFAEAFGWTVSSYGDTQTAEFNDGGNVISASLDTTIAVFNGNQINLTTPV